MRRSAPLLAIAFTFIGGFFVFLGGLLMAALALGLSLLGHPTGDLLYLGLLLGALLWVMAILMWLVPTAHVAWGAMAILLAILSLPLAAIGGFLLGFLFSVIGGILAIRYRPRWIVMGAIEIRPPSGTPRPPP